MGVGNSDSKGIAMLQMDWLRQLHHARRLGFVRSLKRRSLNSAPSAEVLENKCVLSAINTVAILDDSTIAEDATADDSLPSDEELTFEKQDLTDCEFEVCDLVSMDGEFSDEMGDETGESDGESQFIRYSFGMNFRGGVAEGDEAENGDSEVIDGELADEFETVDEGDSEDGEQVKVIYYFGMSGGFDGEESDDSEVEITDLEATEGYVDDVTLMQKEDYVLDDFVTFDDFGAAKSGLADSVPNPMLFRNLSFGGAPSLAAAAAPVIEQAAAPAAAASNVVSLASSDVGNSIAIPVAAGSSTGAPTNLFASQNVISAAPVMLAQLNDGARQESADNGSERSLDLAGSTERLGDKVDSKTGKSKVSDASATTTDSLTEEAVRDSDLKKVDDYIQQVGDEVRSEPQVVPATEMSASEDQNSDRDQTANAEGNDAQHRRQVTDSKIAESEQRIEAIRAVQKQLSENQARRDTTKPSESVRPV